MDRFFVRSPYTPTGQLIVRGTHIRLCAHPAIAATPAIEADCDRDEVAASLFCMCVRPADIIRVSIRPFIVRAPYTTDRPINRAREPFI